MSDAFFSPKTLYVPVELQSLITENSYGLLGHFLLCYGRIISSSL